MGIALVGHLMLLTLIFLEIIIDEILNLIVDSHIGVLLKILEHIESSFFLELVSETVLSLEIALFVQLHDHLGCLEHLDYDVGVVDS